MLQADTKNKHVHINLLYCFLLRSEKAHKGLNQLFLIIKYVAVGKAKHIKITSGNSVGWFFISVSNNFVLILLPTFRLFCPYIVLHYIVTIAERS